MKILAIGWPEIPRIQKASLFLASNGQLGTKLDHSKNKPVNFCKNCYSTCRHLSAHSLDVAGKINTQISMVYCIILGKKAIGFSFDLKPQREIKSSGVCVQYMDTFLTKVNNWTNSSLQLSLNF